MTLCIQQKQKSGDIFGQFAIEIYLFVTFISEFMQGVHQYRYPHFKTIDQMVI